jgi:DNA end-binding protein Ku
MAARAYWKGQIKLALVSIPVEIYKATKSGTTISFRQIHEPSGKPINYEKVVPGIGPVDRREIIKGYEISKGNYVLLDDEEIEAVKLESKRTLDLVQFVDADAIDVLYFDQPYYVVPAGELAEEAYVVLREALRKSRRIGLGQLAIRGQEFLVSIKPCGRGLILETLRYGDEVNKAVNFFRDIDNARPGAELLDLAAKLLEKKAGKFDATEYHNRYIDALHRLIDKKAKAKGKRVLEDVEEPEHVSSKSNVIDLMAALKSSVEDNKSEPGDEEGQPKHTRARARKPAASPREKAPARRRRA